VEKEQSFFDNLMAVQAWSVQPQPR
jgi:hypothetical protein